jgi:hypothetical protein
LKKGEFILMLGEMQMVLLFGERRIYFNAWRKANFSLCLGKGELILMFGERRI